MDDLASFLAEARARLERAGEGAAVAAATVVATRGSTPRAAGARMLVDPRGGLAGTVGGGCGEAEVLARAQRVLATGEPALVEVSLLEEDGWESPSICGGVLDVFLERLGDEVGGIERRRFFSLVDEARASPHPVALVTLIRAARGDPAFALLGRKTFVPALGGEATSLGDAGADELARAAAAAALERGAGAYQEEASGRGLGVWAEPIADAPELVVVGAGHVGAALVRLARPLGFRIVVLDDRPSFANPARLPEADAILVGDPRETLARLAERRERYVVLVTRGHRLDADCLRVALGRELRYLGMIGSRRRVGRIRERLLEEGAPAERLARLHAPIGLRIGAETPAEIAVSILAEIVAVRRGAAA